MKRIIEDYPMSTAYNTQSVAPVRRPLSKGLNVTCWVLQGLAEAAFLAAGGSKTGRSASNG
jgi:hypothetical protein